MQNMFNDPFFAMQREQMRRMDEMFRDPFGGMMGSPFLAIGDGNNAGTRQQQPNQGNQVAQLGPFGMFDMFGNMHRMMNSMTNMPAMMESAAANSGGQFYGHSSVMSYSNDGSGQPKIYQASSTTAQAPGGVKMTRKTLRDSERGIEKMSVGRHLNERAHVMTKERVRSGDINEEEELVNLDDGDREEFDREWGDRTRGGHGSTYRGHQLSDHRYDPHQRPPQQAGRLQHQHQHQHYNSQQHHRQQHRGSQAAPHRGGGGGYNNGAQLAIDQRPHSASASTATHQRPHSASSSASTATHPNPHHQLHQ